MRLALCGLALQFLSVRAAEASATDAALHAALGRPDIPTQLPEPPEGAQGAGLPSSLAAIAHPDAEAADKLTGQAKLLIWHAWVLLQLQLTSLALLARVVVGLVVWVGQAWLALALAGGLALALAAAAAAGAAGAGMAWSCGLLLKQVGWGGVGWDAEPLSGTYVRSCAAYTNKTSCYMSSPPVVLRRVWVYPM